MVVISIFNIILLSAIALKMWRPPMGAATESMSAFRGMRIAAVIFTLVCAYRAILPRIDVTRTCWFDTPLNWVLFGRICATVAEVCWAYQMGALARTLAGRLAKGGAVSANSAAHLGRAGASVIAMACVAECCSWTNLITENNLFACFEQALWMALFIVESAVLALLLMAWRLVAAAHAGHAPAAPALSRPPRLAFYFAFVVLAFGMGVEQGYEAFDLYLGRYIQDEGQPGGPHYQPFGKGLARLAACANTTQSMDDWAQDAQWMTGYFSVAVWSSLWLSMAPLPSMPERLLRGVV